MAETVHAKPEQPVSENCKRGKPHLRRLGIEEVCSRCRATDQNQMQHQNIDVDRL